MSAWPDARVLKLFNIEVPIVLGPMAGVAGVELAIAVARAGGLGSLPCAMLSHEQIRQQIEQFRAAVRGPINLNFFCHTPPQPDPERDARWRAHLAPYYAEFGIDLNTQAPAVNRAPQQPYEECAGSSRPQQHEAGCSRALRQRALVGLLHVDTLHPRPARSLAARLQHGVDDL